MSAPARFPAAPLDPVELARRIGERFPPTEEQWAAIVAPLAPHLVVAGAGSGKTQTMGLRVVWLVANGCVEPHRVLGLTFTRKAAAELGERVRRMLRRLLSAHDRSPFLAEHVATGLRTGEPTVTTYHSYAAALLGEHALRDGREPDTRVIGEAMSWQLAASVVEAYDGPMAAVDKAVATVTAYVLQLAGDLAEHLCGVDDVARLGEQVRARLTSLPAAAGDGAGRQTGRRSATGAVPPPVRDLLATLAGRDAVLPMVTSYARLKRERGVIDYGDQVAIAARIARDHPEVARIEQARFGAVLLDEYQDTGEAQRVLLTSLFGAGHPVTAVGDPRQSIYGWRGASAGNLERFAADFAGPGGGDPAEGAGGLTASFRNGERILAVANRVAAGIPVRGLGSPWLRPGPGREGAGRIECALLDTVDAEADWIADRVRALGEAGTPWREVAVLARKRSHFPRIEAALRARGVPCEVVGLGGLLLEPEVLDVVSTLRVLVDPAAGPAMVRLLTGPRWRLGPRDLAALGRRARYLATGTAPVDPAGAPPDYDVVDERSLVDAVDDLGPADAYSEPGYRRLQALRDELRMLRRQLAHPLPDLVLAVVRATGIDVELASRPGVRPADALANLDRLVEVAEEFVATGEDPGLPSLLGYLDTAEERERGLEVEAPDVGVDRVQLMTVHAAKGLEWDVVFLAGLTESVFPVTGQPVADWTRQVATLPFPLRGDRSELPVLGWHEAGDLEEARAALLEFQQACKDRGAVEERRLAYVAVTRARDLLACSGYWWDDAKKPRGPSRLLEEIREVCAQGAGEVVAWAEPPPEDAANPVTAVPRVLGWPVDPLADRRADVAAGAELVRAAMRSGAAGTTGSRDGPGARWEREADLLLAELARHRERGATAVELPGQLSVSQLVLMRRDPAMLARAIRRPMPRRPAPQARRGTRFHLWLEQRWGQQRLLDVDELPGAADETAAPDADLEALQEAFRASEWWNRVPAEIEFPFDMVVDGILLRGRCDAVFTDAASGGVDVVDWKTGWPPTAAEEKAAVAVQLAVYRLAWHHLTGAPLESIRAAFHYVAANETERPADLLDEDGVRQLLRSLPPPDELAGPRPGSGRASRPVRRTRRPRGGDR